MHLREAFRIERERGRLAAGERLIAIDEGVGTCRTRGDIEFELRLEARICGFVRCVKYSSSVAAS
jgi:hypothetical protein